MTSDRRPLVGYLKVQRKWDTVITRILKDAADDLTKNIAQLGEGASVLTRAQMAAQKRAIKAHLRQDFSNIGVAIRQGQKEAAAAASLTVSEYEDRLFKLVMNKDKRDALARGEALRAAESVQRVMSRLQISQKPLSQQVYSTSVKTNGQLDRAINSALVQGMTQREFAKSIRKFVSPDAPGGASYAAMRLARTEINNAHHATTISRYQKSKVVDQLDWNLSSSHPEGDECDGLADESPYDKFNVPEKPHPQCFCFLTPAEIGEDEFLDKLFKGGYDGEGWSEPDNFSETKVERLGPTDEQKIKYAEIMFGTGSKQHNTAKRRFGSAS